MPMFVNLEASDLATSSDWYQRALGFRVAFAGPPGTVALVHLRRERDQDLLLISASDGRADILGRGVIIQFQAGPVDVAEIARQARSAGSAEVEGPVERPWNVRDVTVVDPDAYRLRFSEPLRTDVSFEEMMGQAGLGE